MISYYQNKIYNLKQLRKRYNRLKSDLQGDVVSMLNKISKSFNKANSFLMESYTIDGMGADNKSISTNALNVENSSKYITGTVIPAIEREINSINNDIYYYNVLIDKERNKGEE